MSIDFIIKAFLWICCLFSRSSGFRICQSSSSKTEKLSCISRASCAQAPRKQKNAFGWSKEGDPRTDDHFLGKKARKIPEEFVFGFVWLKKVRASALLQENWSLSVFACKFDDCQASMFFIYEKRRHARKCVIWPILGTSFSTNRHIFSIHHYMIVVPAAHHHGGGGRGVVHQFSFCANSSNHSH